MAVSTPKRWRFVRHHDKPIHGSCAKGCQIYHTLSIWDFMCVCSPRHTCLCIYIYIFMNCNWSIFLLFWMFLGWRILVFPCPSLDKERNWISQPQKLSSMNHGQWSGFFSSMFVSKISLLCIENYHCLDFVLQTKLTHGTGLTGLKNSTPTVPCQVGDVAEECQGVNAHLTSSSCSG